MPSGARHKVVVFEFNAGNHAQNRALANALAITRSSATGALPIVSVANCLQPDEQNDNGWDQGLLFLNPSQVWLQPPGYVTQMLSATTCRSWSRHGDRRVETSLDATATSSHDGRTLVLQMVNPTDKPEAAGESLLRLRSPQTGSTSHGDVRDR